jgi:hypothetical protein
MSRRYLYPLIVLAAALLIWLFTEEISNNHKNSTSESQPRKPNASDRLSFSTASSEGGALEVKISFESRDTPNELDGKVMLVRLNEDGTDGTAEEFAVTGPYLSCRLPTPGTYRLEAKIGIPDTEYDFLAKPVEIEILRDTTTTHRIVVPRN